MYPINFKHISTTKRGNFYLFYFKVLKSLKKHFLKLLFNLQIFLWGKHNAKVPNILPEISTSQDFIMYNICTVGPPFPNHQTSRPPRQSQEMLSRLWIRSRPVGFTVKARITAQHIQSRSNHLYWSLLKESFFRSMSEPLSGAAICQEAP